MLNKVQLKELVSKRYDTMGKGAFSLALITQFKGIGYNYDATFYKHGLSREDYIDSLIDTKYAEDNSDADREFGNVTISLFNRYAESTDDVCPLQ